MDTITKFKLELILRTVAELTYDFMVNDRKTDNVLPEGSIEAALYEGITTIDEIVDYFRSQLESMV